MGYYVDYSGSFTIFDPEAALAAVRAKLPDCKFDTLAEAFRHVFDSETYAELEGHAFQVELSGQSKGWSEDELVEAIAPFVTSFDPSDHSGCYHARGEESEEWIVYFVDGAAVTHSPVTIWPPEPGPIDDTVEAKASAPGLGDLVCCEQGDLLVPAEVWLWQSGNCWMATMAHEITTWWEGADEADIAARPDTWVQHISDIPSDASSYVWYQVADRRFAQAGAAARYNLLASNIHS